MVAGGNLDGLVKTAICRHSREGGSPGVFEKTGFPLPDPSPGQASREWRKCNFRLVTTAS